MCLVTSSRREDTSELKNAIDNIQISALNDCDTIIIDPHYIDAFWLMTILSKIRKKLANRKISLGQKQTRAKS
jgi:hypothetical protein